MSRQFTGGAVHLCSVLISDQHRTYRDRGRKRDRRSVRRRLPGGIRFLE